MTKSQIDKLGERLKAAEVSQSDLQLLDEYRRSFTDSYEQVITTIRNFLRLEPTGRLAKSTPSIMQKLRRESIRLSQIQDIGGCRIIVADMSKQAIVVEHLRKTFEHTTIIDRREKPSHGYRAVHVVVRIADRPVEVQVRTLLQQRWAEFSEKLADVVSADLKYGAGPEEWRKTLTWMSNYFAIWESIINHIDSLPESEEKQEIRTILLDVSQKLADNIAAIIEQIKKDQ